MKSKLFTLLIAFGFCGSLMAQTPLTKEEKDFAIKYLNEATKELEQTVKGLSEAQLKYRPDANSWSVEDCLKHLTISEANIWAGFVEAALQQEPDPSKRSEVKASDEMILGMIESRDQKVQTSESFQPVNKEGDFKTVLKEFKSLRAAHLKWLKKTDEDLRNRYAQTPVGTIDAYQGVLFISGHVKRHTAQMKEVMASEGFPSAQ
ncbi:MAG: DinB family protein [Cytophagia bacterium]|nr:DinB family protein [Cytophagia bacterium]